VSISCCPGEANGAFTLDKGSDTTYVPPCMKYLGSPQSGSMAGTTASHNRAGQYYRNRRTPVNPVGTGRRAFIRAAFGAAAKAYAALTASQQAAWSAYAASYPVTDALGQSITLTGQQMFVAIGTQLLNVGAVLPTATPATNATPPVGAPTLTAVHAGAITFTPTGLGVSTDYILYAFSAPQSSGTSFNKTFWQAGHVAANSATAVVATTAYTAQFGPVQAGQRIFYKVTPVNQYGVTGTPYISFATVS
jgi:hypothetical protein